MKVTAIKQQINQLHRYSIFIDNRFAFSLNDSTLLANKLVIGQEISKTELAQFNQLSAEDKALDNTIKFASMRLRSEWEITSYLKRKHVGPQLSFEILGKLKSAGLIDDHTFAKNWVESRLRSKSLSSRRLELELVQKHVSREIADKVLSEQQPDDSRALEDLIKSKRRLTRYKNNDLKLMQYLSRQGYGYEQIKNAMRAEDES